MGVNRRKFIGSIEEGDMQNIEKAAEIERCTKIAIIRKGSVKYANEILKKEKKEEETKI